MIYDVIIIGAGLVGGAIARGLSRYKLSVLCLEKEADICCGTSKANTGIIHSPAMLPSGTLKSRLSVKGALEFERLSRELGFVYQQPGALVLGYSRDDEAVMQDYIAAGCENYREAGLQPPEYRIIRGGELRTLEPSLNSEVYSSLYAPDAGRIIPYEYGIASWENAIENGVKLELKAEVSGIERIENSLDDINGGVPFWNLEAGGKEYKARYIVNSSGHGSSSLGMKAGFIDGRVQPVKGQYLILERGSEPQINHIIFQVPQRDQKKKGKGILVTRTAYGNIMIGPDARWQEDEDDTSTDMEALDSVIQGALHSVPGLKPSECIKTFAGVRPKPAGGDFIIESREGFIHLCGIESPGLTSSPAIVAEVIRRLEEMGLDLNKLPDFQPFRKPVVKQILNLEADEVKKRVGMSSGSPERLVCRCEQVPEDRIVDAINRGIPVTTLDGVKRRTRAGQGKCQGGFCGSRVRSLLSDVLGIAESDVSQRGLEPELERISAAEIRSRYNK